MDTFSSLTIGRIAEMKWYQMVNRETNAVLENVNFLI